MKPSKFSKKAIFYASFFFFFSSILFWAACKKTQAPKVEYSNSWGDKPLNPPQYGLIRTPTSDYKKIPVASIPVGASGDLDSKFELQVPTTPFYQGTEKGSCGSCASAMAKSIIDFKFLKVPYPNNGIIYSPDYLYSQTILDKSDCKSGSNLSENLKIMLYKGICKLSEMPYKQNDCTTLPTSDQDYLAASHKIGELHTVQLNVTQIKQEIKAGYPVVVGFAVDDNFDKQYWTPANKNIPWSSFGTPLGAAHATVLYGWDDSKNSFRMLNEWGKDWGNNGSIWVDYKMIEDPTVFYEAYVVSNASVPSNSNSLQLTGDLNFGDVVINTNSTRTVQLTNSGNSDIIVSNILIEKPFSSNWNGGTISAGKSINITLSYLPTTAGSVSKDLSIVHSGLNSPITLKAIGNGTQQTSNTKIISLIGDLSFGNTAVGSTSSKSITITNIGNSTLNITSIFVPAGFSGNFTGAIQPGQSINVPIYFNPSNLQTYTGSIIINSDATSGANSINITGTGIQNGNGGSVVTNPAMGSYGNCSSSGTTVNCDQFNVYYNGVINAKVIDVNTSTHRITFEIKKCNGTIFSEGGKYNVVSNLCSGDSFAFGTFQAGQSSFQVTATDYNMTGTKVYYPFIIQGPSSTLFYNAPYIIITY